MCPCGCVKRVCSEEIAFYNGSKREKWIISHTFDRLIAHMRRSQQFRYLMGMIDTLVAKYFATVVGFWVISRPAFGDSAATASGLLPTLDMRVHVAPTALLASSLAL